MRTRTLALLLCLVPAAAAAQVKITKGEQQIAVEIGGQPFTDFYIQGPNLTRPYLHPLRTASGKIVNRSFPAGQVPGETTDHPHHAGLFYGHGDVNGFNYWAVQNVPTPPSKATPTFGRIVLKGEPSVKSGKDTGTIDVVFTWLKPDGGPLMTETRRMTFHSHPMLRIIDFDFDFAAIEKTVFRDTKEGTFALRMATVLEEQAARLKAGPPARTGKLVNAQGAEGEPNVWGKRSEWVDYSGVLDGEKVGVVMMDHPSNPRHPTYWHSRGYGLHSINPFGVSDFLNDKTQNGSLTLEPGQHVRFRYRVIIHPGRGPERIAELYQQFAQTKSGSAEARQPSKPNILMIAVDDLNHWVGHLGRNKQVMTPNIDRLAKRGVTFTNAHTAAPVCNPSRAALMSGLRPSTTGVYDNAVDWRPHIAVDKTLITHFRSNGYVALGAGKIYHGLWDRQEEWDEYGVERRKPCKLLNPTDGVGGIRFSPVDCDDDAISDYSVADYGIAQLQRTHAKPFLLTIGFHKPHMPWNVPKKYFDMYPLDKIELPPYREDDLADIPPAGVRMARSAAGANVRGKPSDHELMLQSGRWKEAVQAYLATITYVDGQIGRVLDALDASPHRDNTIVVLYGDHGWNLGEKHHWRKFSLWEESTRAPLIWVAPGVTKPGGSSHRTVDFMTIYPTLSELAGLPIPRHVEGPSLRSLLIDPAGKWDRPAVTTHEFRNHAVRTADWRYIRYADGGEELYDKRTDAYEWTNLASDAKYATVKTDLAKAFPQVNTPRQTARDTSGER